MKLALVCLSLLALPWSSTALFFATAGAGAVALTAGQAGLLTLGVIGAKVAGLAAGLILGRAASRSRSRSYHSRSYYRPRYYRYYRGKREVNRNVILPPFGNDTANAHKESK